MTGPGHRLMLVPLTRQQFDEIQIQPRDDGSYFDWAAAWLQACFVLAADLDRVVREYDDATAAGEG